jgi:hypothetical protein
MSPHPLSLYVVFENNALHRPDAPAVVDRDRVISHGEVFSLDAGPAGGLPDLGARSVDRARVREDHTP